MFALIVALALAIASPQEDSVLWDCHRHGNGLCVAAVEA